jgi:hypothetical protein
MLRLFLVLLLPFVASAARWTEIRSGPFDILTDGGDKPARELLNQLEQLRWGLGAVLGKEDMKTTWPVRVVLFKDAKDFQRYSRASLPAPGRDSYVGALQAGAPAPRAWLRECARILLESNAARMPAEIESGLLDVYSTLQADGPRITLGAPPPPAAERTPAWAKVQMISVEPEYYGKMRVLLYNLQRGADPEPAYRNAFGKTPAQMDKEAAAYLAAGNFQPAEISGRPLDPRRDFHPEDAGAHAAEIAMADLGLRLGGAAAAYQALMAAAPAVAHEGLGLVALSEKRTGDARKEFQAAIDAGTTSARAYTEFARLEPAGQTAWNALSKAIALNPNWAEPHEIFAQDVKNPQKRIEELKAAATLAPRNAAYWCALAEEYLAQNLYADAGKAWAAAENASVDDAERARIQQARLAIDKQRLDYEAAERRRQEAEKAAELQKVKDAAMERIRQAEARANANDPKPPPNRVIIPWPSGPEPTGKANGRLVRVECLKGGVSILHVEGADGKLARLLVADPGKITVMGTGQDLSLKCGVAARPRPVEVKYFPRKDARHATAGDVASVEFMDSGSDPQ